MAAEYPKDPELKKIQLMLELCDSLELILSGIKDEEEYKRVREYINSRYQGIDLPYSSPFIKKEAN